MILHRQALTWVEKEYHPMGTDNINHEDGLVERACVRGQETQCLIKSEALPQMVACTTMAARARGRQSTFGSANSKKIE